MARHTALPLILLLGMGTAQGFSMDGTWELVRIFRTGPQAVTRLVPIDSTTYLRLTLTSHPGGWLSGTVYRRHRGDPERSKLTGGVLGETHRYALSADFDRPLKEEAHTAAWFVGRRLRLGTSFVPDADSLELKPVAADAPSPAGVWEVVTSP
jgi:hypothetical protein